MAISPDLLAILCCPKCRQAVVLVPSGTALACARCALAYPVVDDIPVMLADEALPWPPRT